jgi:hypothetical protein
LSPPPSLSIEDERNVSGEAADLLGEAGVRGKKRKRGEEPKVVRAGSTEGGGAASGKRRTLSAKGKGKGKLPTRASGANGKGKAVGGDGESSEGEGDEAGSVGGDDDDASVGGDSWTTQFDIINQCECFPRAIIYERGSS